LPAFLRKILVVCLLPFLGGCPSPSTYTVPRTLDRGDRQVIVAPELVGYRYDAPGGGTTLGFTPTIPSLGIRFGATDRLELGVRVANLFSPAVDAKIQLVRSVLDLAVDPGAQFVYMFANPTTGSDYLTQTLLHLYLPLLVGLNLSESLTLVAAPGVGYALGTPRIQADNKAVTASGAAGAMVSLAVGVEVRASERFALHPELTLIQDLDDARTTIAVIGVGFNFGAQPNYADLAGAASH
jgi:hypothetical protein